MIGLKFLAGLGTIFIFIGYYLLKAASQQKPIKKEMLDTNKIPVKYTGKTLLFVSGCLSGILGIILLLKALKLL